MVNAGRRTAVCPALHPKPRGTARQERDMIIGVPKEIKDNEARVGITPAGVRALTEVGHEVLVTIRNDQ